MNNVPDIENILHSLKEEAVPSDALRTNARIRILNTVTSAHPFRPSWYSRPRVLGYTFGSALATVLLSVGTVYAAQSSLPNSTLYPVKVLSERVALTLSPTESIKTSVANSIISRRIDEIEKVQKQGNQKELDQSIANFDEDVAALETHKGVSRGAIDTTISGHKSYINSLRKNHKDENRDSESQKSEGTQPNTSTEPSAVTPTQTITQPEIKLPSVEGVTTNHEGD